MINTAIKLATTPPTTSNPIRKRMPWSSRPFQTIAAKIAVNTICTLKRTFARGKGRFDGEADEEAEEEAA